MRAIIVLSVSLMVGCGGGAFTSGDPASSDPTGAEMSPGMTPSPSSSASVGNPPSVPDSGTVQTTPEGDAGPSATIDANPPTGGDAGATTPDTGVEVPDSGVEVDAGHDTGVQVVDSGSMEDATPACTGNAYCVGASCPGCSGGEVSCIVCTNGVRLYACALPSVCLSR